MIELRSVTYRAPGQADPVFQDVSITLPMEGVCGIWGERETGCTTLLRLISGKLRPSAGHVVTPARPSPILHDGAYFNPRLSTIDNITLVARSFGLNAKGLTELALSLPAFMGDLQTPVNKLNGKVRRGMEALLAALLPIDLYLMDNADQCPPELLPLLLEILSRRGIGLIFATHNRKFIQQQAVHVKVIQSGTILTRETMGETSKTNG